MSSPTAAAGDFPTQRLPTPMQGVVRSGHADDGGRAPCRRNALPALWEARSNGSTRKPVLLDDLENSKYYIPGTSWFEESPSGYRFPATSP